MVLTKYIVIEKKNEVYLKVEAEPSIKRDLSEYFSFEMTGFKFTPQYKSRVWDGKIRLFQYASGHIYVGLYPYLLDWCKKNEVQFVDGTKIQPKCGSFLFFPATWTYVHRGYTTKVPKYLCNGWIYARP